MQTITSIEELKSSIQLLEIEQAIKEQALKEQFYQTYDALKPVSILKNTMKEITSSPYLVENILGAATGMATGYLSKKIIVGASGSIVRKIVGSVLQFGITNLVAQHPDKIKEIGHFLYQRIFRKKKLNSEKID